MKPIFIVLFLVPLIVVGEVCDESKCLLENGCVCSSNISPLPLEQTPQFVVISIDDAINEQHITNYYHKFFERKNPDGSPVGLTFFVPHEYTDYTVVNQLYNRGYEIGVNSISKGPADYWSSASQETLTKEFKGQKLILNKFAGISLTDIQGVRTPQFQLKGDTSIKAFVESELSYDSSWPAFSASKWFPYTLDYESDQECLVGECPIQSYPQFWVSPINNLRGNHSVECNVLFACFIEGSADVIADWLIEQFENTYTDNRAPFTLLLNSGFFNSVENSVEGFFKFMDYLAEKSDTFVVSARDAIDWRRNPVDIKEYKVNTQIRDVACRMQDCRLKNQLGEDRRMIICGRCPKSYPTVDNPSGD